jgi:hypothetical protein
LLVFSPGRGRAGGNLVTRRTFLAALLAVPAAALSRPEPDLWATFDDGSTLHGLLACETDGAFGTWAGIERSTVPFWRPHPAQLAFLTRPLDVSERIWTGASR